jgi:hypothetical protein
LSPHFQSEDSEFMLNLVSWPDAIRIKESSKSIDSNHESYGIVDSRVPGEARFKRSRNRTFEECQEKARLFISNLAFSHWLQDNNGNCLSFVWEIIFVGSDRLSIPCASCKNCSKLRIDNYNR